MKAKQNDVDDESFPVASIPLPSNNNTSNNDEVIDIEDTNKSNKAIDIEDTSESYYTPNNNVTETSIKLPLCTATSGVILASTAITSAIAGVPPFIIIASSILAVALITRSSMVSER